MTSPLGGILLPLEANVTMVLISEVRSRPGDTTRLHKALKPNRPDINILTLSGKTRRAAEGLLIAWNQQQQVRKSAADPLQPGETKNYCCYSWFGSPLRCRLSFIAVSGIVSVLCILYSLPDFL